MPTRATDRDTFLYYITLSLMIENNKEEGGAC